MIGLSLSDFCDLTPPEFEQVCNAYEDHRLNEYQATHRNAWERMRFLALFFLLPYSKKALKVNDIVVFDWEKKKAIGCADKIKKVNSKKAYQAAVEKFNSK